MLAHPSGFEPKAFRLGVVAERHMEKSRNRIQIMSTVNRCQDEKHNAQDNMIFDKMNYILHLKLVDNQIISIYNKCG